MTSGRRHLAEAGATPRHARGRRQRPARPVAESPRRRRAARSGERDPYLDNVKLAAILLVVVGHVLEAFLAPRGWRALYFLIYSFHMPVFVLVAGHLSRRFTASPAQCRQLVSRLVAPYLVFQLLYSVSGDLIAGDPVRISLVTPDYLVWFLMSLAAWRLLGVVIMQLRFPLVIAVGISLAVGMSDVIGRTLSLSRTLALLPFYVAGLMLRREHLAVLHSRAARRASAVVLVLAAVTFALAVPWLRTSFFYWRDSYHRMDFSWTSGIAFRCAALLVAATLTAAFLAAIPHRALPFTRLGENTMVAYLLHGFLVRPLRQIDGGLTAPLLQIAAVLLALGVGILLLTPPLRRVTRHLVEPNVTWLLAGDVRPAVPRQPAPDGGPPDFDRPAPGGNPADLDRPAPGGNPAAFDRLLSGGEIRLDPPRHPAGAGAAGRH